MSFSLKKSILARIHNRRIRNEFAGTGLNRHPQNRLEYYKPLTKETLKAYKNSRVRPEHILCYAPFKNLYFGLDGKATACCYNRDHVLGTFPQQTIKDIWFGDKAEQLREYIKYNDLSLGCIGCKHHLEGKNFSGVQAKDFDDYPVNRNRYPSVISFELSNNCNLECVMCSAEFSSQIQKNSSAPLTARGKALSYKNPYNADFLEQLKEFIPYLNYVKFYGGEPFLIDYYYKIWEALLKNNPRVTIEVQTNATVLNNKVKTTLNKGRFNINISLDSLEKANFELIRKNAKFERVMENAEYFRSYCKTKHTRLFISVCPMRQNWRELPGFIKFCNEKNAFVYFHLVWNPPHCALWNLDSETLGHIVHYLSAYSFPQKGYLQKYNRLHYTGYVNLIMDWQKQAIKREEEARAAEAEEELKKSEAARKLEAERKKMHYAPLVKAHGAKKTLCGELNSHIQKTVSHSEKEKEILFSNYLSQIDWVSENLPPTMKAEDVFEALLAERPLENIIMELEKNDKHQLLETAILFAHKIAGNKL